MKKTFISLFILFVTSYAYSQQSGQGPGNPPDPETRAKEFTKRMKEIIQFSDEQEKQVYELNLENAKKRRELFQNRTTDREAMREKMQTLDKEYDASLKNILNEQQYKKYKEERENLRQRPSREGENPRGGGNPRQGNRGGRN